MCDFKPGDEVVCVDDQWRTGSSQDRFGIAFPLTKGNYYTVSFVELCPKLPTILPSMRGKPSVFIDGARNIGPASGIDIGFDPSRFRKVQRRSSETGMAILKSICDNPGQLEEDTKHDQVEKAARMVFGPWGDYTDDGTFGLR